MSTTKELEEFDRMFADDIKAIRDANAGRYGGAVRELLELSLQVSFQGAISARTVEEYSALITLVERASRMNLDQAALKERIVSLGNEAVGIAKKTTSLASIF
jgi:hypothetical protein